MRKILLAILPAALLGAASGAASAAESIDLSTGWRFGPDPDARGIDAGWHEAAFDHSAWPTLEAGKRWEDQGFAEVDGVAWYRRTVPIPPAWHGKPVWLVLGGINDSGTLYCNGQQVDSYGDRADVSVHSTPLIAEIGGFLEAGEENLIAVQVYDWGESGGLWRLPCALTRNGQSLPLDDLFSWRPNQAKGELVVECDVTGLGNSRKAASLYAQVFAKGVSESVAEERAPFEGGSSEAALTLRLPNPQGDGPYTLEVQARGPEGKILQQIVYTKRIRWPAAPAWPGAYGDLTVRNNFVTELLTVALAAQGEAAYSFTNPREGWVFLRLWVSPGMLPFPIVLNDGATPLVFRTNPDTGALESMQYLAQGVHQVHAMPSAAARFEVRTMPEIAFCYYPSGNHIPSFGPFDWDYVTDHVLPHVNTLISRGDIPPEEFDQWRAEGRSWIGNASLPGLSSPEAPASDDVYTAWAANRGVTEPGFGGLMVDEFLWRGEGHYTAWSTAVERLVTQPGFGDRKFYAWCVDLSRHKPGLEFSRLLTKLNQRFAWEVYLPEASSPEHAERDVFRRMTRPFAEWRKLAPGIEEKMVVCLGYLSAPPESLNLNPGVDYQVFLDMQFHALATDPAFWGLHGVMEYMAAYADEESVRWAHQLFRHYCIEGNRDRFTADPYVLPHLRNPDFEDGLEHWDVQAAEAGHVEAREMKGFSWLQGRYPRTRRGDTYCWMKHAKAGQNAISQTLRKLVPGRLYSVKLISADPCRLHEKQLLPLYIAVNDAQVLEEYGFQEPYPSCYSHEVEPYTREKPAWFNFHRLVFRAGGATARLTIQDWPQENAAEDAPARELALNFLEVQPFRAPNCTP